MSAFDNDDTYNVIAEHVLEALQADAKLGTDGDLEIATWEQELREHAGMYNDNELPAVAATIHLGSQEVVTLGDRLENGFGGLIMVYTTGGQLRDTVQLAKRIAARIERVMQQQHLPDKQLSDLPTDLDGGEPGSVVVAIQGTQIGGGNVPIGETEDDGTVLRGVAAINIGINVEINMPED